MPEPPKGNYIFHFNPKRKPNFFSILVMSRTTGKVVRAIEPILLGLVEAQKNDSTFVLNRSQLVEVEIFKQILKTARQDKKAGWYDIPIPKFAPMFPLLAVADEVLDEKTKHRIKFTDKEWRLVLSVNSNPTGNIMLELFWRRPDKDDIVPLKRFVISLVK